MHLFFTPDISGKSYTLSETESKHCIRVLRLGKDDIVCLIDGHGGFYKAQIIDDNPKSCNLEIIEESLKFEQRPYYLHIAMAPTKNMERLEWFLEKAVEIGIDEFTPVICERSERKTLNADRLEKIAISAMKQSIKAYKPKINLCTPFKSLIKSANQEIKMIAYCNDFNPDTPAPSNINLNDSLERKFINNAYKKGRSAICLIGPEGDFTQSEINASLDVGFTGVTLGKSRLRVETAGLVICHTIYYLNSI
jgi:16S rRNA (uracil1498-N3)-methyltransferase